MIREFGETRDEDVTVQGEVYTANVEYLSAINENPGAFDILSNLQINGVILHELQYDGELFHEIDYDRIPNYQENVPEVWRSERNPVMVDNPWGVAGSSAAITGIYNSEELDFTPTTWADIKRDEVRGDVTLADFGIPRYTFAAATLGVSPAEGLEDDALYQEIWDEASRQGEFIGQYWSSLDEQERLYREEVASIGSGNSATTLDLQDDDLPFEAWVPESGVYPAQTTWGMVEESDHKDFLYDFLNWFYRRENAIEHSERANSPIPLKDPPESVSGHPDYFEDPGEAFLSFDFWSIIPQGQRLAQTWAEVKA
jgi:spermidine/putrescine-binding protein